MHKTIAIKPRLTEKAYALSEDRNTYTFVVQAGVSRLDIAKAVAVQYGVAVESVRITAQPSKNRRTYRRGGRVVLRGKTAPIRKAYVRLKEGDKLPIFAAVNEDSKSKKENK
ncbi:MAG TPA: 50S ribosomal protein L23 [Candidatus Saccharimonadales bacterium]|nr:50S ribosomal protein L23 [Candidatus Saccharimonadales bacterium]